MLSSLKQLSGLTTCCVVGDIERKREGKQGECGPVLVELIFFPSKIKRHKHEVNMQHSLIHTQITRLVNLVVCAK